MALIYWYDWWKEGSSILIPIILTLASAVIILWVRHRKQLLMTSLVIYCMISLKVIFINRQVALGLTFLGVAFLLAIAIELFIPDKEEDKWLKEEAWIGDDTTLITDLGLRSEIKPSESQSSPTKSQERS
jgi:hypothetical protein